ncbi:glycosyltransferase [Gaetbulibacter jejuensis]|uniref:Glycosyltransferase 2-like domain-containing protein n=1 Tax=Gaetbulibacter jejuensis TaxID=584607 RepID=A0ABN1JWZ9_9FLAO
MNYTSKLSETIDIVIVSPVYNDWESFRCLLKALKEMALTAPYTIKHIVAVNDGSVDVIDYNFDSNFNITVVELNCNMGHQRAISVGLSYVNDHLKDFDNVVVMDCDGEDRPEDIAKLVVRQDSIVFAKREKRNEGFVFRFFYKIYKRIFSMLTTKHIDFGNFSSIPHALLGKVVAIPELWNHYSGAIIKSKVPYVSISTDRGSRYQGESKMNFQSLVLHGLSSISIYLDVVSVRLLFLSFFCSAIVGLGLIGLLLLSVFTKVSFLDWPSIIGLVLINILAIVILITFLILLFQLNQKSIVKYPPKSFYTSFILSTHHLN